MILKYIQLALPNRKNESNIKKIMADENCTYEEAYKIDYDINWKFKRRYRFELESRCIVSMFFRLLGRYDNKDCKKIVISCCEKNTRTYFGPELGICKIGYELKNVDDFFLLSDSEKKECFFNIIKESITTLAESKQWNLTPLQETFDGIEKAEYNNNWTFGSRKRSPNKLYTAELYIEHDISELRFYILIRNQEGDILQKKLMIKEEPRECYYEKNCGKIVWVSDNVIRIKDKVWTL